MAATWFIWFTPESDVNEKKVDLNESLGTRLEEIRGESS